MYAPQDYFTMSSQNNFGTVQNDFTDNLQDFGDFLNTRLVWPLFPFLSITLIYKMVNSVA